MSLAFARCRRFGEFEPCEIRKQARLVEAVVAGAEDWLWSLKNSSGTAGLLVALTEERGRDFGFIRCRIPRRPASFIVEECPHWRVDSVGFQSL